MFVERKWPRRFYQTPIHVFSLALSPSFFLRFLSCSPTFRVPPLKWHIFFSAVRLVRTPSCSNYSVISGWTQPTQLCCFKSRDHVGPLSKVDFIQLLGSCLSHLLLLLVLVIILNILHRISVHSHLGYGSKLGTCWMINLWQNLPHLSTKVDHSLWRVLLLAAYCPNRPNQMTTEMGKMMSYNRGICRAFSPFRSIQIYYCWL